MRFRSPTAVALSAIALVAILLAACGSSSTASPAKSITYDFTYDAKVPAQKGGTVVFGDWQFPDTLNNIIGAGGALQISLDVTNGLYGGCVVQMPDLSLGADGWKADQCLEPPTVANGGESKDGLTTTFKLDPKAKWSDGMPITADDYLLQYAFATDVNVGGTPAPFDLMKSVKKIDDHTVQIQWSSPYAPYFSALWAPEPLHVMNAGKYAGLYDASTGKYNTAIAQKLVTDDAFNTTVTVTNGPFTVQSYAADDSIVMVKNPNYYSNFFKGPFLDKVVFKSTGDKNVLIQSYKAGQYDHVRNFTLADLPKFSGIPSAEIVISPFVSFEHLEFNQRPESKNAKLNPDKVSIFTDKNVRKAFIEAFNRCAAILAIIGIKDCNDPNIHTDELTAPPDAAFDPAVTLPAYNPDDAAALMDAAGYKIVNGKRMFKDGKTPITIDITSTTGNNVRDSFLALMRQAYANALNITVTTNNYKTSIYFTTFSRNGILANGAYDVSLFGQSAGVDGNQSTGNWQSDQIPTTKLDAGGNYSGLNDPNVDAQLSAGRQTLDVAKRKQIYHDLNKYITDQYYFEALYIRPEISLTKPTLGNYKQHPTSAEDKWNIVDWYTTASR